jgi:hypothetical protein
MGHAPRLRRGRLHSRCIRKRKPMAAYRFGGLEGTLLRPDETGLNVHDRLSGHYRYG